MQTGSVTEPHSFQTLKISSTLEGVKFCYWQGKGQRVEIHCFIQMFSYLYCVMDDRVVLVV